MNNKLKKAIASLFLEATLLTARTSVHAMPVSFTIHMKDGFVYLKDTNQKDLAGNEWRFRNNKHRDSLLLVEGFLIIILLVSSSVDT